MNYVSNTLHIYDQITIFQTPTKFIGSIQYKKNKQFHESAKYMSLLNHVSNKKVFLSHFICAFRINFRFGKSPFLIAYMNEISYKLGLVIHLTKKIFSKKFVAYIFKIFL